MSLEISPTANTDSLLAGAAQAPADRDESWADKALREANLIGSSVKGGFADGAREAWDDKAGSALRVGSGVLLGFGLSALSSRAGLANLAARGVGAALGVSFAFDLADPARLLRISQALHDAWQSESNYGESLASLKQDTGRFAFDLTLTMAGGVAGAHLGSKVFLKAAERTTFPMLGRKAEATRGAPMEELDAAFRPVTVSVSDRSWLGQRYTDAHPVVGRIRSLDGDGGTAFILDNNLVLTAYHSLSGGTNKLPMQSTWSEFSPVRSNTMRMSEIKLPDGRIYPTELVSYSDTADVAVLRIHADKALPGLKLADHFPTVKERAAAIGYPRSSNSDKPVISPGATRTAEDEWTNSFGMRTWKGNSGGPIVGEDGRVIGLVSRGNAYEKFGTTKSPKLEDMQELVTAALRQRKGAGIVRIEPAEGGGKTRTVEPTYDWWMPSNRVQHDFGKDVDPALFRSS